MKINNKIDEALEEMKRFEKSITGKTDRADDLADCLYNQACYNVLLNNEETGLDLLEKAVRARPSNATDAKADADFKAIKDHERFKRIVGI